MRQRLHALWSGLSRATRIVIITIVVMGLTILGLALALAFSGGSSKSAAPTTTTTVTTTAPAAKPAAPSTTTSASTATTATAAAPTTTGTSTSTVPTPGTTTTATAAPSTTPSVTTATGTAAATNPTSPAPPPVSAGSPTTTAPVPGAPPAQQYPQDGKVHVYVDLNDYVHDGQLAQFTFKIVNGTAQPLPYTRAAVLMNLDGAGTPKWTPVYDLTDAEFQYDYWWVRTATIAPGSMVQFEGKIPIPDRTKINSTAATACLYGLLQVNYPDKPNATLESPVKSEQPSCSEYSAG